MKTDAEYLEYLWPMRHYLITCGDINGSKNIITVSFCMPVSKNPPVIGIAIMKESFSYSLISKHKEFAVNVPLQTLDSACYYCGYHSGRDIDKFEKTGLTPLRAKQISAPIIDECIAHIECFYMKEIETGDKVLILGEVIEAYGDKNIAEKLNLADHAFGDFPEKVYGGRFPDAGVSNGDTK